MADYSLEDEEYRRREYMFQAQEWNKKVRRMYNQNKLVDGVTLSYETVFGINYQKIHRNLINVGEGFIIFSVGTSIAIKDLQTKTTKFFTKENRLRNITCLNAIYEKDENILIAVGESTPANEDRAATVTLINTKENKWTHMNTNLRAYIKEIIIETDKKYCAALVYQFQASYPQILFWNYQKEKIIGQAIIKIPIEKMSFDPIRPKQILIQTPMYLRVWELDTQDKTLKEAHTQYLNLKKEGNLRVLDHCWLPHGNNPILLILVNNNILHIAQNDTIKKTHNIDTSQMSLTGITKEKEEDDVDGYLMDMEDKIDEDSPLGGDLSPMSPKSDSNLLAITQGVEFSCIAPTKKGFILGGSKGIIGFYEIEKSLAITNALSYQCPNPEDCKVVFVSTNQNDSITSAVTANVSNGKFNYFLLNIFQIDSTTSPVQQFFNTGYHSMAVTSMSVCRARSILATCSDDGYVKLWNYFETEMDEKKGFITQYFKETPCSVSIHPCSQFLAVAFGTFYKIFSILSDSLQPLTTVNLTSCKLVKYTNGGHYLIANERSNIIIFDTVYYDALHIFDSHTSLIKDFVISEDDKYLVSTCEGGFIYVWDLAKPEKNLNKEWRHKNTMYNKILYDCESDLMYGCTGEKPVCVYGNLCKEKVAEFIASNTDHDTRAAVISTKHQVLFTGTNKGTIKVFLWPMVKESFEIEAKQGTMGTFTYKFPECVEYNVHLSPVTYLEVSHDGNYLFSGAADGSVFIFKITDVNFDYSDAKKGEKDEKQKLGAQANDIYLEKLSKIKEQNEHIKKLHFEVTKGQQAVKIELKKLEMMFKSKIETINEEFNIEMKANSEKKDKFTANAMKEFEARDLEHGTLKNTFVDGLKHSIEENKFKEEYEIQRNKDIEKEMEDIKVAQQAKLMEMYKKYQKELDTLRSKYQEKCQGVQAKYNAVTDQAKASGVYFLQKLEKHEADCERENEEKTKELIIEIAQEKHVNKGLVEINSKLHSKNEAEKRMDTEKQNKLDEVIAKNNRLKEENINHMASLLKMQEQILEREEVILSKEETCKAARDEQINLENFRYLLDQKIKTLTNEKDSMLDKISSQEKLLKDTFQELITESGRNDQKHEHLKKKETKLRVMNTEQQKVDMEIIELRNRLSDSINNLDKVIGNKEKEKWPEMLHNMLDKARNANAKEKVSVKRDLSDQEILEILKQSEDKGFDVNDELLKQAKWITKKLYLVNVTGKKLRDIKEESIQGILGQNGQLIEECNMLRTENETLSHKMKFLEKVVQDGMKKMKKMENTVSTPISMKMNKSQVKLEKISSTVGSGDETQMSPIKDPFSSPDVSAKKKLFNSEQKARNLLGSNKYSPDTLSKKTKLASVSPQKSSKSSTSKSAKGLGFMLHEVPNQGL